MYLGPKSNEDQETHLGYFICRTDLLESIQGSLKKIIFWVPFHLLIIFKNLDDIMCYNLQECRRFCLYMVEQNYLGLYNHVELKSPSILLNGVKRHGGVSISGYKLA